MLTPACANCVTSGPAGRNLVLITDVTQRGESGSTRRRKDGHPEQILRCLKDASKDDLNNLDCALLTMTVFLVLSNVN